MGLRGLRRRRNLSIFSEAEGNRYRKLEDALETEVRALNPLVQDQREAVKHVQVAFRDFCICELRSGPQHHICESVVRMDDAQNRSLKLLQARGQRGDVLSSGSFRDQWAAMAMIALMLKFNGWIRRPYSANVLDSSRSSTRMGKPPDYHTLTRASELSNQ
ncbi:hypothetical protein IFM51744_11122 [Aspergillus udagawae]|nr:hypothetical protein IFM51744_11122 [Aspergillus udagawae]